LGIFVAYDIPAQLPRNWSAGEGTAPRFWRNWKLYGFGRGMILDLDFVLELDFVLGFVLVLVLVFLVGGGDEEARII